MLCSALNIHDSGVDNLAYRLERDGAVQRRIDPRDALNKWPVGAWQQLNSAVQAFFHVSLADGVLNITAH